MAVEIVRWSSPHDGVEGATVARSGDLVVAASVSGLDPRSGEPPAHPQDEFDNAFANLAALLAGVNITLAQVGLVNVWIASRDLRPYIDPAWSKVFPGPTRPARKTNEAPVQGGARVLLQAFARRGDQVTTVDIPGMMHRSPLPPAARLGSWVFSSVIGPDDPSTGVASSDPKAQIQQAFSNVETAMRAAGGDAYGVNHLWVFLSDMAHNKTMLESYLHMFPKDGDRPARKTVKYNLPPGACIQIQMMGDTSPRQANFEAPGVGHHDPIPLGSKAGGLLTSSGVHGIDPVTSKMITGDVRREVATAFANVDTLLRVSGGSLDDIAGLTVLVRDYAFASIVRRQVEERCGARVPALQFVNYPLPGDLNVQFHVAAAL